MASKHIDVQKSTYIILSSIFVQKVEEDIKPGKSCAITKCIVFKAPILRTFPQLLKVRSFLEHSCAILSSFKIVIIFDNTSSEIKTKSVDVLLKMITILKELRITQLCSRNEGTLLSHNSFVSMVMNHDIVISDLLSHRMECPP